MASPANAAPLRIAMISVHGLIRGHDLELGRDADTGGQTKYVVELARELGRRPDVAGVDLFTRRIADTDVAADYATPIEPLGEGARIVRVLAGPPEAYLPKEELWDHLDQFADEMVEFLRAQPALPDVLHSHYADAGYVGSRLAHMLGVPLVHTGHSLGRVKRRRLIATGLTSADVDERYNMSRRIEAEESTLASAERVITSTRQEIDEQYALYDLYQPDQMRVIPPGTDLELFRPPTGDEWDTAIGREVRRFLHERDKPLILALARPDPRKNLGALVEAYGTHARLQELANLLVVAGTRDDVTELDERAREVLTDLILAVDRHDLYGRVAYPKRHEADDVPTIYRLAAASGGVFVNPALTEPFGLTLIEAAASGLPVVATHDGGPRDIIANCDNGVLVDPLDTDAIAAALVEMLEDPARRDARAAAGMRGVREHYSWAAHARRYIDVVRPLLERTEVLVRREAVRRPSLYRDRALFTDLDECLLGDLDALPRFCERVREHRSAFTFGIATGRRLDSALKVLRAHDLPEPDVLITSCGTAIHYTPGLTPDSAWVRHLDHNWTPHVVRRVLDELPGLELQPKTEQSRFKVSYYVDEARAPSLEEIHSLLRGEELAVNAVWSFGQYLDVLPIRASKGLALRHTAHQRGIPLERILVAAGSAADEDMVRGNTLAVVVEDEELSHIAADERVHVSARRGAHGILEAFEHFDFLGACRQPAGTGPA